MYYQVQVPIWKLSEWICHGLYIVAIGINTRKQQPMCICRRPSDFGQPLQAPIFGGRSSHSEEAIWELWACCVCTFCLVSRNSCAATSIGEKANLFPIDKLAKLKRRWENGNCLISNHGAILKWTQINTRRIFGKYCLFFP